MSVPFIDLKRFEDGFVQQWMSKIEDLTINTRFIGGDEVSNFETSLKEKCRVDYVIGCASGTDALQLALRAAGIGPGDKVLIPDSTFWATFEAVVNVGASPWTVDITLEDLQMDYEIFIKAAEEQRPKAAMLVHLYGWGSSRINDFRKYCKENDIILIEDGAQSFGVEIDGESIYKDAFISTLSFYPAKVFGAAGDAGAVLTSDENMAERIRSLANHGREAHYAHGLSGWNSRLDTFQAAFMNLALPHIKNRLDSRRKTAEGYTERLTKMGVKCVSPPEGYLENGYLNATLHDPEIRSKLVNLLKEKGIGFGIVYPGAVSEQKGAEGLIGGQIGGDEARKLSKSVLNLPLFQYMTDEEFEEVISVVGEVY